MSNDMGLIHMPKDVKEALGPVADRIDSISLLSTKYLVMGNPDGLGHWSASKRASLATFCAGNKTWAEDSKRDAGRKAGRRGGGQGQNLRREESLFGLLCRGVAESRNFDRPAQEEYIARQAEFRLAIPGARHLVARLGGRLLVDHAGGVLESAGLNLDPHFGIPGIPGSAVKGCARAAALAMVKSETDGHLQEELAGEILDVFGFLEDDLSNEKSDLYWALGRPFPTRKNFHAGQVAFLSAVPLEFPKMVVDLLACHHPKYYANPAQGPGDDEQPNIQPFPAVESGLPFLFSVVPARNGAGDGDALQSLCDRALEYLEEGLKTLGIGAKTAAGYGWFIRDDPSFTRLTESFEASRRLKADERRRRAEDEKRAQFSPEELLTEELETGTTDVLAEFARRTLLSVSEQERLASFILSAGPETVLNPAGNPKGRKRLEAFRQWIEDLDLEGS